MTGTTYATVTQQSGYYEARYDENRSVGTDSYAFRNFGVEGSSLLTVTADIRFEGDTSHMIAGLVVGADGSGSGVGVLYADEGSLPDPRHHHLVAPVWRDAQCRRGHDAAFGSHELQAARAPWR